MKKIITLSLVLISVLVIYFILRPSNKKLQEDLNVHNHTTTIIKAAYKLGERKDVSAVRPLLSNILDPRMSTHINFKGMNVCYSRLVALRKISGLNPPAPLIKFSVDTISAKFYLNWAIEKGIIKSPDEINLNYH
ncbi:MAG: hypothetical protein HYX40_12040 [Sphingobacteriales bacterium]|nr:hypothetical protein [Sphingobacteriales bacterium]